MKDFFLDYGFGILTGGFALMVVAFIVAAVLSAETPPQLIERHKTLENGQKITCLMVEGHDSISCDWGER